MKLTAPFKLTVYRKTKRGWFYNLSLGAGWLYSPASQKQFCTRKGKGKG